MDEKTKVALESQPISNLRQLKERLNNLSDDLLVQFGVGFDPEADVDVAQLMIWENDNPHEAYRLAMEIHPDLVFVQDWIDSIVQLQVAIDKDKDVLLEEFIEYGVPVSDKSFWK